MSAFKVIRKRLGLTQAAMAEGLGCTQGNVSFYERGQTVPPPVAGKLIELAKSMGHSITYDDVYAPLAEPDPGPANRPCIAAAAAEPTKAAV